MRMYDIIEKKRDQKKLTKEEIDFFINNYTKGEIPDYQVSALLMAVFFNGMDMQETVWLTDAMLRSGDMVDLSSIEGIKADKHSTGGVGDKTTLIIAPIVAAAGIKVAKMSGRGLGHTGGTIDKLESIPGFKTEIRTEDFLNIVKENGLAVVGQTGNLVPADKKIYALRDVTATVNSMPLIASSIMSKKLELGANEIILDVKCGSEVFMKTIEEASQLSEMMVKIGTNMGRKIAAIVTDMDTPLGYCIGNSLEVIEAIETLKGNGPKDLMEICVHLSARLLSLAGRGTLEECKKICESLIYNGQALEALIKMITAQGGNSNVVNDYSLFPGAKEYIFKADKRGYINRIDSKLIGNAAMLTGAGRITKDSIIDYGAGIVLKKKTGDIVNQEDELCTIYTNKEEYLDEVYTTLKQAFEISDTIPNKKPIILKEII